MGDPKPKVSLDRSKRWRPTSHEHLGDPSSPAQQRKGDPIPTGTKCGRRGGSQAARGSAAGLTAFSFEDRDTIRRFDHFCFCFYASILAVLSWELGEKHIFLYHF